jgi:hypothetical protein
MKRLVLLIVACYSLGIFSQEYNYDTIYVEKDTIGIDSALLHQYKYEFKKAITQCSYWSEILKKIIDGKQENIDNIDQKYSKILVYILCHNKICPNASKVNILQSLDCNIISLNSRTNDIIATQQDADFLFPKIINSSDKKNVNDIYLVAMFINSVDIYAKHINISDKIRKKDYPFFEDCITYISQLRNNINQLLSDFDKRKYPETMYENITANFPVIRKTLKPTRDNSIENYAVLDSIDFVQQNLGLTWIYDNDNIKEVSTFYPAKETYFVNRNYPNYKIFERPYIMNIKNNLVFVERLMRLKPSDEESYSRHEPTFINSEDFRQQIFDLLVKKDFIENKYNIQNDKKEVVYDLKRKFNIIKVSDKDRMVRKISKFGKRTIVSYEYAFKNTALEEASRRFITQCLDDHKDDLRYIYKIDRIDNITFQITYMNKNKDHVVKIQIKFYTSKNNNVDYLLDLI